MKNISKRQRRLVAKKLLDKPEGTFTEIDLANASYRPDWMTRAYRNNKYIVMINDSCPTNKGFAIRAMIQKHDDTPILNHWSELQRIKNEIFGPEIVAVEYYPKESELTNLHNIYWLWMFNDGILPETNISSL